jgi:hypothetical protein
VDYPPDLTKHRAPEAGSSGAAEQPQPYRPTESYPPLDPPTQVFPSIPSNDDRPRDDRPDDDGR